MNIKEYKVMLNDSTRRTELLLERSFEYSGTDVLDTPEKIVGALNKLLDVSERAEEHMYLLTFSGQMRRITGLFEVSHGSARTTLAGPREIYIRAAMIGAEYIVLVHNHPGGDCTPSKADMDFTERIKEAGRLLDIPMSDHIIVGDGEYYSFTLGAKCKNK